MADLDYEFFKAECMPLTFYWYNDLRSLSFSQYFRNIYQEKESKIENEDKVKKMDWGEGYKNLSLKLSKID